MKNSSVQTLLEGFATKEKVGADQYRCDACGGIFDKGWTDEEADAEYEDNFGDMANEERALVCDDCYKKLMAQLAT